MGWRGRVKVDQNVRRPGNDSGRMEFNHGAMAQREGPKPLSSKQSPIPGRLGSQYPPHTNTVPGGRRPPIAIIDNNVDGMHRIELSGLDRSTQSVPNIGDEPWKKSHPVNIS